MAMDVQRIMSGEYAWASEVESVTVVNGITVIRQRGGAEYVWLLPEKLWLPIQAFPLIWPMVRPLNA